MITLPILKPLTKLACLSVISFATANNRGLALSEPDFSDPDMAVIFNRVAPHFSNCAGSPIPGMIKGEGTYKNEAFYVGQPEMVMPTGGGTLSAMVSFGDNLELELSDTGYFNALADNKSGAMGAHVNPLLSPGHVSIKLPNLSAATITHFDQRIDFAKGSVVIELQTREGSVNLEVMGDMSQDNLVITVKDDRNSDKAALIAYENWRDSMLVKAGDGILTGEERADVSTVRGPKAQSMSLALLIGCIHGSAYKTTADANSGSITVPSDKLKDFTVVISAKCAHGPPPVETAVSSWNITAGISPMDLEKSSLAWWRNFWSHSWLDVTGPDADYLTRLWLTTLYSYAIVGQGPVIPKFNGGPGLVFKDARSWGDGYWWQNQREISFWPMSAAGHPEFTRKAVLFFNQAFDVCQKNARHYGMDGTLFLEGNNPSDWSVPFGESYPVVEHPSEPFDVTRITPPAALKNRLARKAGYNGINFVGGLEFTKAIFDYVQFEGDKEIADKIGGPWLKGEVLMCLSLLTQEEDGKYHVQCADATEQWWKVNDPAPIIAGVRYALTMAVKHGEALGFEPALISTAREHLDKLVSLPTVSTWNYQTVKPGNFWSCPPENITPGDTLLAPFSLETGIQSHNMENPELYSVFPFEEMDMNSSPADQARAKATFFHRFFKNSAGWSQCPVQAARLGLTNTMDVILEHARNAQKWPYGGWNSPAGPLFKGSRVTDCPFFDAAGVNMTALQESLLQSHSTVVDSGLFDTGKIRLLPAVSSRWSGQFLLHARGGFTVTVKFANGTVEAARFEASRDGQLRIVNPFRRTMVWLDGAASTVSENEISIAVKRGQRVVLAPAN
jgi:hypothetical protein